MSPLRRRMIEDMRLRNFSACTERSYVHYVADFALHYNTSPEHLGLDDIRNYQLYLTEKLLEAAGKETSLALPGRATPRMLDGGEWRLGGVQGE